MILRDGGRGDSEADRPKIEKSLVLAEKYCVLSKVARAAMPVKVEIEAV